jgi:hypothetical protein
MTSTKGIKCVNCRGNVPFLSFPCPHCGQDPTKSNRGSDVISMLTSDVVLCIGGLVLVIIILIWNLE